MPEHTEHPPRDRPADAVPDLGTVAYRPVLAAAILALGLVMVAAVFPGRAEGVGDGRRTRIARAAADAAVQTLRLTVPVWTPGLDGNPAETHAQVLLPKPLGSTFDFGLLAVEFDSTIEPGAEADLYRAVPYPVPGSAWRPTAAPDWAASPPPEWIPYARTFTEASFWDAEIVLRAGATPDRVRAHTWVAPAQNLLVDARTAVGDTPPYLDLGVGSVRAPPRVHLLDRVYPPGRLRYNFAKDAFWESDLQDPKASPRILTPDEVYQAMVRERYTWHVIHSLGRRYEASGGFRCTIVVTQRDTTGGRYARQADPVNGDLRFDLGDPEGPDARALRVPATAGAAFDTVFPQAWLVVLDEVVPETGTVVCTRAIARMLPAGSWFIIARTATAEVPAGFEAGTPHRVLGRGYEPGAGAASTPITLRIARTPGPRMGRTAAWVFPPPVRDHGGGTEPWFDARSPVIGAFIREIASDE